MSNKLRWGKFYWSDWADDPALALCSHAAQGVWMRLLCIAAQGEPYGHVTVNGKPPSTGELARLMRPPMRARDMQRAIDQLLAQGVAKLSPTGALLSPRMSHDWTISSVRAEAAKSRWNKEKLNGASRDLHMQTDGFAYTESRYTESQETHTPDAPARAREKPHARPDRNAAFDMLREMHQNETKNYETRQYNTTVVDLTRSLDNGKRKPH